MTRENCTEQSFSRKRVVRGCLVNHLPYTRQYSLSDREEEGFSDGEFSNK